MPAVSSEPRSRSIGEDSDVTVALIRTAFIIAFIALRQMRHGGPPVPLYVDLILLTAGLFNLLTFMAYLASRSLHPVRPLALALDLALVTAVVYSLPRGRDLWDLYYLVVITGAVWFRRGIAILIALVVIGTALLFPVLLQNSTFDWQLLQGTKAPLLLLITLITAYLVRAHDAEHSQLLQMNHEMNLARQLQSRMLPDRLPDLTGYELGVIFQPARLVGGDFYDLRLLDSNHLLIVLADLAGKSVYGLVHMSLVHSHLQNAIRTGLSPSAVAAAVNRGTYETLQPESYAALFIGVLRLSDGRLIYTNAGHLPPVYLPIAPHQSTVRLATRGLVIGGLPDTDYAEGELTLGADDVLVCFSDGVSDIRNHQREFFGEKRVMESLDGYRDQSAQTMADSLAAELADFAAQPGDDDLTLLIIRRQAATCANTDSANSGWPPGDEPSAHCS